MDPEGVTIGENVHLVISCFRHHLKCLVWKSNASILCTYLGDTTDLTNVPALTGVDTAIYTFVLWPLGGY